MSRATEKNNAEQFVYDAFISYSHRDNDWVRNRLLSALEAEGLKVCIDSRDFELGVSSMTNMEYAVEKSRKTLLVLTPSWVNSEWTNFEALIAQTQDPVGRGQRLLPLMVIKTELPKRLEMLTYLDLTNSADFEFQIKRLLNAIRNTEATQDVSSTDSKTSSFTLTAPTKSNFITSDFNYLRGLITMSNQFLTADVENRLIFTTLDSRLRANLRDESMFGSSETLRNERNRIVYELNRLALIHLNKTFNEMCGS